MIYLWQSKITPVRDTTINTNAMSTSQSTTRNEYVKTPGTPCNNRHFTPLPHNERGRGGRGRGGPGRPNMRGGQNNSGTIPYNNYQYPVATNRFGPLAYNGEHTFNESPRQPFLGRGKRGPRGHRGNHTYRGRPPGNVYPSQNNQGWWRPQ